MTAKTIGRVVGALFLLAFVAYLGGSTIVDASSDASGVSAGALLMLVNSAVVVGIGVLAFPVLKRHDELSAYAYLIGRAIEGIMLAVGVVFLLLSVSLAEESTALSGMVEDGNDFSYQIAMISLAVVGMLFCRVLLRARLVPRFMAVWGLAGYFVFLAGAVLEVLGYGVGLALSVPGGIFEIALGIVLVVKGFPERAGREQPESVGLPA